MSTNDSVGTASCGPTGLPASEGNPKHRLNAELRRQYLDVEARISEAEATGSTTSTIERLRKRADRILGEFCQANKGLVINPAKRFRRLDGNSSEDYAQAGFEGLVRSFLTWDPAKASFATWSRANISGEVRREVRRHEHPGISYSDWTARVTVLSAVHSLADSLGRAPTHEEVATRTGYTATLVERVRAPKPDSLDRPVGDGESVLGDIVSARLADVSSDDDPEQWLVRLGDTTTELSALELLALIRRVPLDGAPPQSLVEIADAFGIGREMLRRAEVRARAKLTQAGFVLA